MSLAARSNAPERMDTDCVDYADYARCLHDLSRVNVVTRTHAPVLAWLARLTRDGRGFSLLDVACGHGDALRRIRRRWPEATLTGVDLNAWATRAANAATPTDARIEFVTADVFAMHEQFDFIISSQFTHHLTDAEVVRFIGWMEAHARRGWFIGDLHRHVLPYYGFGLLAWVARWHRFVRSDGRISIARSFVRRDWYRLIEAAGLRRDQVRIAWHLPFRLCVSRICTMR